MSDRRRINGPSAGTTPLVFRPYVTGVSGSERPQRERQPDQLRKLCTMACPFLYLGATLIHIFSPEDRLDTLRIRVSISRIGAEQPEQDYIIHLLTIVAQTHLHYSRASAAPTLRSLLATTHLDHTCQIRALRIAAPTRLYSRHGRARSWRAPGCGVARGNHR